MIPINTGVLLQGLSTFRNKSRWLWVGEGRTGRFSAPWLSQDHNRIVSLKGV